MRAVFRETPDPPCRNLDYTKGIITVRAGGPGVFCIRDLGVAIIGAGIIALLVVVALAEWVLERPTRAERRAMKRAAAQIPGGTTM